MQGLRALRPAAALVSIGATWCAFAVEAQATGICTYDPASRVLELRFTPGPGGFNSTLYVDDQTGEIETATGTDRDCSGPMPTLDNVDRIELLDRSGRANQVQLVDLDEFATDPSGSGPIEFEIALGPERNDLFVLQGDAHKEGGWRLGSGGLDMSASSADGPDIGLSHHGVDRYLVSLGYSDQDRLNTDNRFSAMGGQGTGEPLKASLVVEGNTGNDVLTGTPGSDYLYAADGEDELYGRGGADRLNGDYGPDVLSGGRGSDSATWPSGIGDELRIDIGTGGANDGSARDEHGDNVMGDVENLFAGGDHDVLIGDDGPNVLVGGDSSDRLVGRGGDDVLVEMDGHGNEDDIFRAGSGNDMVIAHDDFRDTDIDCAAGEDRLFIDELDSDGTHCEDRSKRDGPRNWRRFGSLFSPF